MNNQTLEKANHIVLQIKHLSDVREYCKKTIGLKQQVIKISLVIDKIIEDLDADFDNL